MRPHTFLLLLTFILCAGLAGLEPLSAHAQSDRAGGAPPRRPAPPGHDTSAQTDKKAAKELYEKGKVQYDLGRFEQAVEFFKQGYEKHPDPNFLYSIAQAYRQLSDCKSSIFFYRRYLSAKKNAPNRAAIEKRIAEIDANCQEREVIKEKPPTGTDESESETGTATDGDDGKALGADASAEVATSAPARSRLALRADLGPAFLLFPGDNTEVKKIGAVLAVMLGAGYPLAWGHKQVDLGLVVSVAPIRDVDGGAPYYLTAVLANAALHVPVAAQLAARADLGVGPLVLSGLGRAGGNPFTGDPRGALVVQQLRLAAGLEYRFTPHLAATFFTAFSASQGHAALDYVNLAEGTRPTIDSFRRVEILGGVHYRL